MRALLVAAIGTLVLAASGVEPFVASATAEQPAAAMSPRVLRDRYCVTCHNQRLRTADLTLDTVEVTDVGAHPEIWEKVARKLRAGAMPPAPRPRPDAETYEVFTTWLETELDRVAATAANITM